MRSLHESRIRPACHATELLTTIWRVAVGAATMGVIAHTRKGKRGARARVAVMSDSSGSIGSGCTLRTQACGPVGVNEAGLKGP